MRYSRKQQREFIQKIKKITRRLRGMRTPELQKALAKEGLYFDIKYVRKLSDTAIRERNYRWEHLPHNILGVWRGRPTQEDKLRASKRAEEDEREEARRKEEAMTVRNIFGRKIGIYKESADGVLVYEHITHCTSNQADAERRA
jgi:hypothetical protein